MNTFKDAQPALEFYATPLGVQADSSHIESKEEDFDFATQWHSKAELTDFGYLVKLTAPCKSL
jgi:hypothetical protein